MNDDLAIAMGERLERIAVALERIEAILKSSDLATFHQEAARTAPHEQTSATGFGSPGTTTAAHTNGPIDPEPPFPGPSPEFRQSRDLPAEPFAAFPRWSCPVHHGSKVVPAGVSRKTGKPYSEFLACSEPGCNEKPPFPAPRR